MARIEITNEVAEYIKTTRLKKNIQSAQLAEYIHKSPAYISKLEKGELRSIDAEDFCQLIDKLFGTSDSQKDSIAQELYDSLRITYSEEELEQDVFYSNIDTVFRHVEIPQSFGRDIDKLLLELGISRDYLLKRINNNESLSEKDKKTNKIEDNMWYLGKDADNKKCVYIRINMTMETLNSILDGIEQECPHVFAHAIAFYTYKIKMFGEKETIKDEEVKLVQDMAGELLLQHNIYRIAEKQSLLNENHTNDFLYKQLNTMDYNNYIHIQAIVSSLRAVADISPKKFKEYLDGLYKNIQWDPTFCLKTASLDFASLEQISISNKIELINQINELIKKYRELPESEKRAEIY